MKSATKIPIEIPGTIIFGRKTVVELPSWVTLINSGLFGLTFLLSVAVGYILASPFMAYHVARQAYEKFVARREKETKVQGMNTDTATYDEDGNVTSLSSSYPVQATSSATEATEFSADDASSSVIRSCESKEVASTEAD
jgi:hypothetical protein